jgi:hypothetical protein
MTAYSDRSIGYNGAAYFWRKTSIGADGRTVVWSEVTRPGYWQGHIVPYVDHWGAPHYKFVRDSYIEPKTDLRERTLKRSRESWNGYQSYTQYYTKTDSQSCFSGFSQVIPTVLDNTRLVALDNKLASAIRGHQFNLAVAMAQPRLTGLMLTDSVTRIAGAIKHLRSGNFIAAAHKLGVYPKGKFRGMSHWVADASHDVSALWLELQYGWKPLLSDVHDAAEALSVLNERYVTPTLKVSKQQVIPYYVNDGFEMFNASQRLGRTIRVRFIEDPAYERAAAYSGIDPLSLVWEVLPFSFVADWFIPVGTYLDSLNVLNPIVAEFLISDWSFYQFEGQGVRPPGDPDHPGYTSDKWSNGMRVSVNRVQSYAFPLTKPKLHAPKVSTYHFWNSLAIMRQLIGKT